MPDDKLKKLHENLLKDNYQLPEYSAFAQDMRDEASRNRLWSSLQKDGYNLPDFETFSNDLGFGKKKEESVPGSGLVGQSTTVVPATTSTSGSEEQDRHVRQPLSIPDI